MELKDAKADKLYAINLLSNGHPTANTTGYTAVNSTLGFGASGLTSLASAQNGGFTSYATGDFSVNLRFATV